MTAWRDRYGRWGLVAGASEGLGAAFAVELAARGLDVIVVARRADALATVAADLRARFGVEVRELVLDLAAPEAIATIARATATLEIGVAIYDAAFAPLGGLLERSPDELARVVDVNVRGPLLFARAFAAPMAARGRGALVLMSSLAGLQGVPRLAAYAASKAFAAVLAEGLWAELRGRGVDVTAVCAGAIRTPGYRARAVREDPGILDAAVVARTSLDALGRGPRIVPGWINAIAAWIMGRLLPRRWAIAMMERQSRALR